jgi:hypothetical protein
MSKIEQWITEFKEFGLTYKMLTVMIMFYLIAGTLCLVYIGPISATALYLSALLAAIVMKINAKHSSRD